MAARTEQSLRNEAARIAGARMNPPPSEPMPLPNNERMQRQQEPWARLAGGLLVVVALLLLAHCVAGLPS